MSLADSLRDWEPGTVEMAFVTIRTDGVPAMVEEQGIVYRSQPGGTPVSLAAKATLR
jgi:hypothetical protein